MVQPIMKFPLFLARPSLPATRADLPIAQDLLDTLAAHSDNCVGMAANMIGQHKRIIAISTGFSYIVMLNPVITSCKEPYEVQESCLSLEGARKTTRYQTIEVSYLDQSFNPRRQVYTGWIAQVIQHEIDHCDGILI